MKPYHIHYLREQLEAAAKFLFEHNKVSVYWNGPNDNWTTAAAFILDTIRSYAAKNMSDPVNNWTGWVTTCGFTLIFSLENDDTFEVDILVNPSVNSDTYSHVYEDVA